MKAMAAADQIAKIAGQGGKAAESLVSANNQAAAPVPA
jgi:hypothetical protein